MGKITDSKGREVRVSVCGAHDDIQIDGCSYVDDDSDVSEAEVDWIYENCGDALYEEWCDHMVSQVDFFERDC